MGKVRIVGPGKTRGYPYLVSKKLRVDCIHTTTVSESLQNKRPMGHKAHQSSGFKLPSPAFGIGMMINAYKI